MDGDISGNMLHLLSFVSRIEDSFIHTTRSGQIQFGETLFGPKSISGQDVIWIRGCGLPTMSHYTRSIVCDRYSKVPLFHDSTKHAVVHLVPTNRSGDITMIYGIPEKVGRFTWKLFNKGSETSEFLNSQKPGRMSKKAVGVGFDLCKKGFFITNQVGLQLIIDVVKAIRVMCGSKARITAPFQSIPWCAPYQASILCLPDDHAHRNILRLYRNICFCGGMSLNGKKLAKTWLRMHLPIDGCSDFTLCSLVINSCTEHESGIYSITGEHTQFYDLFPLYPPDDTQLYVAKNLSLKIKESSSSILLV